MHIVLNAAGQVAAFGGRDLVAGPDQSLVPVLNAELARAESTAAALPQAGQEFMAAVQARAGGSIAAGHDLPALDKDVAASLKALTTAQIEAAQAEEAYAAAGQALQDALVAADQDASGKHGEFGVIHWDAGRKRFVAAADEQKRAIANAKIDQELAEAQANAKKLARLRERAASDPDFALLAELAGVQLG